MNLQKENCMLWGTELILSISINVKVKRALGLLWMCSGHGHPVVTICLSFQQTVDHFRGAGGPRHSRIECVSSLSYLRSLQHPVVPAEKVSKELHFGVVGAKEQNRWSG